MGGAQCLFCRNRGYHCVGNYVEKNQNVFRRPRALCYGTPGLHLPTVGNVLRSMWERAWSFIKKAGTVILLSAILLWFLQAFGFENGSFGMVTDLNNSILAVIGSAIEWIFIPLGWGEWRAPSRPSPA